MTDMPPDPRERGLSMWKGLVEELRKHPGEPVLIEAFTDTPRLRSLLTMVNSGRQPALAALPGRVTSHMRGSYVTETGIRRGDLWVVWHPEE